ncbi:MAG: glycerate kinase [Bacillota bacterium]
MKIKRLSAASEANYTYGIFAVIRVGLPEVNRWNRRLLSRCPTEARDWEEIFSRGADMVITGEGEINRQTAFGKVPVGVAKLAKKYGIPVIALVGSVGSGAEEVLPHGIDAYFSLVPRPMNLGQAFIEADGLLAGLAEHVARLIEALSRKN